MTETVSVAAICGVPRPSDGCLLNGEPRVYTVFEDLQDVDDFLGRIERENFVDVEELEKAEVIEFTGEIDESDHFESTELDVDLGCRAWNSSLG